MPSVGFEPTIAVFDGPKRVHALNRAAAVIGFVAFMYIYYACSVTTEISAHCTLRLLRNEPYYNSTCTKISEHFFYIYFFTYLQISQMIGVDHNVTYIPYAHFILQDNLNFEKMDEFPNELHEYETDTNQILSSA
jgi:hypothetical protein